MALQLARRGYLYSADLISGPAALLPKAFAPKWRREVISLALTNNKPMQGSWCKPEFSHRYKYITVRVRVAKSPEGAKLLHLKFCHGMHLLFASVQWRQFHKIGLH